MGGRDQLSAVAVADPGGHHLRRNALKNGLANEPLAKQVIGVKRAAFERRRLFQRPSHVINALRRGPRKHPARSPVLCKALEQACRSSV
jgi:hypothetical protein